MFGQGHLTARIFALVGVVVDSPLVIVEEIHHGLHACTLAGNAGGRIGGVAHVGQHCEGFVFGVHLEFATGEVVPQIFHVQNICLAGKNLLSR